jgi:hypothetical protein
MSPKVVSWDDKQTPRIEKYLTRAIEAFNPAGSLTGLNIWLVGEYARILAQWIDMAGVPEVYGRAQLIQLALARVKTATSLPTVLADAFREAVTSLVAARLAEPTRRLRLVLPLHLDHKRAGSFQRVRVMGVSFRRREWKELSKEVDLKPWWRRADLIFGHEKGASAMAAHFIPLEAMADARKAEEAFSQVSVPFELLRAVLNLQGTWGRMIIQSGQSRALGDLLPAPAYAVFDDAGKEEAWYYTTPRADYSPLLPTAIDWRQARRLLRHIGGIQSSEVRQIVIDAVLKYGEALETAEWRQTFLSLWQALEILALVAPGEVSMRDVGSRIALLLGQRAVDRDLLEALAVTRNTLVHAGRYPDSSGLEEMQLLKSRVERSLSALLSWAPSLRSLASLRRLYDYLGSADTDLKERHRMIAAIRRRRRKKTSP